MSTVKHENGTGNVVVITGASRGIGLETSLYLAERGFTVYATMRDLANGDVIERLARERSLDIRILQLDITDSNSITTAVNTIINASDSIYGLVNNAGIYLRGYFEDLSEEEIRHVFDTNVFGTMAVIRAVLPHMREVRHGRIVTLTSVAGRSGSLIASAYCASRHAQEGFCESLVQEVNPLGIQVVLIEPAIIRTDRWATDRCTAQRALDPKSPYYVWFQQAKKLMDQVARSSPTVPLDVAKAVYKALTVKRPRLRYMVGRRARLAYTLRRYIPGELFERFFSNQVIRRVTRTSSLSNKSG